MKKLITLLTLIFAMNVNAKEITLTADNTLVLNQQVDALSVGKLMQEAIQMDSKLSSGEPIYLYNYTPGGSVDDGNQAIQFLASLNRPVHTITQFSASMGFQIVQGLGSRYILPNGTLMAHKASGGVEGEIPGQIQNRLIWILKMINRMDQKTVERSAGKLTLEKFKDMYENELYLDGQDAVEAGLADEVVTVKCDQSLKGTKNQTFNLLGFTINVEQAMCPTNQGIVALNAALHTNKGLLSVDEFLKKGGSFGKQKEHSRYDIVDETTVPVLSNPEVTPEIIEKQKELVAKRFIATRNTIIRY